MPTSSAVLPKLSGHLCTRTLFTCTLMISVGATGTSALARSVFINGVDVSSGKNLQLKNVSVTVSENGDVFISAPQYQVNEEYTFTPLSPSTASGTGRAPKHRPIENSEDAASPDAAAAGMQTGDPRAEDARLREAPRANVAPDAPATGLTPAAMNPDSARADSGSSTTELAKPGTKAAGG